MAPGESPSRAAHRFSEETINVHLATLLADRGLDAAAETIQTGARPDVLVLLGGLKLVIEGRSEKRRESLMRDASERVAEGLADIAIGLLYPHSLYSARSMTDLSRKIESAGYDGAIFYFGREGIESSPFEGASLDELVQTINAVFRLKVRNDVVREHVANLQSTLEDVVSQASMTDTFFSSKVLVRRLKAALGIEADASETADTERD